MQEQFLFLVNLEPFRVLSTMKTTNNDLRQAFSVRLQAEFKRLGFKPTAYTQITSVINQQLPDMKVTPQAVRKWLLAEAFPAQNKLVMLAVCLGVSAQWLRYGTGERALSSSTTNTPQQASSQSMQLFGYEYVRLIPLLDIMAKLSARDLRIVEGLVRTLEVEART
jgi:hypothetical protein